MKAELQGFQGSRESQPHHDPNDGFITEIPASGNFCLLTIKRGFFFARGTANLTATSLFLVCMPRTLLRKFY